MRIVLLIGIAAAHMSDRTLHRSLLRAATTISPRSFNSSARTPLTRVCGNFCGPGWCDGKVEEECAQVSSSGASCEERGCSESGDTDGSCADACCMQHDACCGSSDRRSCNKNIVACLDACPTGAGQKGCGWEIGISVAPSVIETAMNIVSTWCCGEQC